MFGEDGGSFLSTTQEDTSDEFNQKVDEYVKKILDESHERVYKLITSKESELWKISKGLFWYDYLDKNELDKILKGEPLSKPKVRDWNKEESIIDDFVTKIFGMMGGSI